MEDVNGYIRAHDFSINHKPELINDSVCGCFYCMKIYSPKEVIEWVKDTRGTAICPYCGIDSVVGESSGYSITVEFLQCMHDYWF